MMDVYGCIICTSCGRTVAMEGRTIVSWGHSHNLPKGRFKELETDKNNISQRCQENQFDSFIGRVGCHEALDRCDMHRIAAFRDLEKIMMYRRLHAPEEYNKFVSKFEEAGIKTTFKHIVNRFT
jgi:hypothetical protein